MHTFIFCFQKIKTFKTPYFYLDITIVYLSLYPILVYETIICVTPSSNNFVFFLIYESDTLVTNNEFRRFKINVIKEK